MYLDNGTAAWAPDVIFTGLTRVFIHISHRPAIRTGCLHVTLLFYEFAPVSNPLSISARVDRSLPAMTAHYALSLGGDLAGRTVLITGGAGAVGNYAIQLAKRMGAAVITTVSSGPLPKLGGTSGILAV